MQTAIYGTPFCTSCKKAFYLIARNIGRIAAVSLVSEFVIIIGKVRSLKAHSIANENGCGENQ
jgi:choline transporter-like protein 2/4/5